MDTGLPFNPLRDHLYEESELYAQFDAEDSSSFARCADVAIFQRFKQLGVNPVKSNSEGVLHALHDNSVARLIDDYITGHSRVVAVMGGHKMERNSAAFRAVVEMAQALGRAGALLTSGGGPGAMEATHLGDFLSSGDESDVTDAIKCLSPVPRMPASASRLVKPDGSLDLQVAAELHAYLAPAISLKRGASIPGGCRSLAVPTWLYGHEPSTPFAAKIGKYFQNSIREDGLVTIATGGIIFTEGKAGTIQEIFQDAAQNYYLTGGRFCKMIFLSGPGTQYWESTLPVRPLIEALLGHLPDAKNNLLFTDDWRVAVEFILK
jgi:hypothetical protein